MEWGVAQPITRRRHFDVQMRRPPRSPASRGQQVARSTVGRNLVWRRHNGGDVESTLAVGMYHTTQVPLGKSRGELRVEPGIVGVPDVDRRVVDGPTIHPLHPASESQRCAGVVLPPRQRRMCGQRWSTGDVVGTLDCSLAARPFGVDFLLYDVFEENVEKQRPFAVRDHLNYTALSDGIL